MNQAGYLPIRAHQYPWCIIFFGITVVSVVIYAFFLSIGYLEAAIHLHQGKKLYSQGNYDNAINEYRLAADLAPNSKEIDFSMAESYFANQNKEDDLLGLEYLEKYNLTESEWVRITKVMPVEYEELFEDIKK